MLLHPEVQMKAQEEIDRVVGRDRLPEISDRGLMPYLQCVMHETMRYVLRRNSKYTDQSYLRLTMHMQMAACSTDWVGTPAHDRRHLQGNAYPKGFHHHRQFKVRQPHIVTDIYSNFADSENGAARSITWDESKFRDARSFRPERFLPKPEGYGETFLPNIMFGWGRRSVSVVPDDTHSCRVRVHIS